MKQLLITTITAVVLVGCGSPKNIQEAARQGNIEAVKEYLAAGTDVNVVNNWRETPLHHAALGGQKEIAELLIAEGADVNTKSGDEETTPLHWAANRGHEEVAELLIAKGADVNAKDIGGYTPLDYTEGEIADLLRKHGGKTGAELKAAGK
jgi:ankyrin repeat protein